jgi:DNA polymerase IV
MAPAIRQIAHLDLDAFYASVEVLLDPSLRNKPVIVGGSPEGRGVVASASYEARACGVRSAMPVAQALRLCPQAIRVSPRHGVYGEHSRAVMALLEGYTPVVEQLSIDEAFLDLTGCETLWGPAPDVARQIQARVRDECGLPCSLGVATNKLVAKIACGRGKPQGLVIVPPGQEAAFLAPLAIETLWGVGEATGGRLRALGVTTIGQLAERSEAELLRLFGEGGRQLHRAARGQDSSPVQTERERRSISQEHTFTHNVTDRQTLQRLLLSMADHLAAALRREMLVAQTVRLKLRYDDFETFTRQVTLDQPTDQAGVLYHRAVELLIAHWNRQRPVRLIGLGASGLLAEGGYQLDLFDHDDQRSARLSHTLDEIRARFGTDAIKRASLLGHRPKRQEPPVE